MRPQHPRNHFGGGNGPPFNSQGASFRPQNGFGGGQRFSGNPQWQGPPTGPSGMRNGPPAGPSAGRSSPRLVGMQGIGGGMPIRHVGAVERQGPREAGTEQHRGGWKKLAPAAPLPAPSRMPNMREDDAPAGPSRGNGLSVRPAPMRQWGGREVDIPSGPSSQTNVRLQNEHDGSQSGPGARWRKIAPPPISELLSPALPDLGSSRRDSPPPRRSIDTPRRHRRSSSSPLPSRSSPPPPKRSDDRHELSSDDEDRPPAKRHKYSGSEESDDGRGSRRRKGSSRSHKEDDRHGKLHDRESSRRKARDSSATREDRPKRRSRSKRSMSVSDDGEGRGDYRRDASGRRRLSPARRHRSDRRSQSSSQLSQDEDARYVGRETRRNGRDEELASSHPIDREPPPHLAHARNRNDGPPFRESSRQAPSLRRPSRQSTSRPARPSRSPSPRTVVPRDRAGLNMRHRRSVSRSRSRNRQDDSDDDDQRRRPSTAENGSRAAARPMTHPSKQQPLARRSRSRSPPRRRVGVSRSRSPSRTFRRRSSRSPSPRMAPPPPRPEKDGPMRRWGPRRSIELGTLSSPPYHEQGRRGIDSTEPVLHDEPNPSSSSGPAPRRQPLADQGEIYQSGKGRGQNRRRRSSSRKRLPSWNRDQERYREEQGTVDRSMPFDDRTTSEALKVPAPKLQDETDVNGLLERRLSPVKFSLKGESFSRPSAPTPNAFSVNQLVEPPSDEEELTNLRSALTAKNRAFNNEHESAPPYLRSAFDAMVRADPSMTLAPEAFLRDHLRRPPIAADTITLRTLQGLFIVITGLETKERELARKVAAASKAKPASQRVAKATSSFEVMPSPVGTTERKPPTPATFTPRTAEPSDLRTDYAEGPATFTPTQDNAVAKAQLLEAGLPADNSEAYHKLAQVGEGTYGKVYKARNNATGNLVALKRIRMEGEKDGFPVTAMREIRLLQGIDHANVLKLHEMMVSKGSVYMVLEYMDHDLTGILSQPQFDFQEQHLKSLCQQMLSGLDYLHDHAILHRDMKGSNILLNRRGELKLADFGLARVYHKRRQQDYTNRVITLWYRSPELLLGETMYGPCVDMWSAGCIMLELFVRKPIFQGQDEISQLDVIYSLMGTPNEDMWPGVATLPWWELVKPKETRESGFVEYAGKYLTSAGMDLAAGLLTMDPSQRLSATKALSMPYFTSESPPPELPSHIAQIQGEWHEMEAKQERARKRHRESVVKKEETVVEAVMEEETSSVMET